MGLDFSTGDARINVSKTCLADGITCWPVWPIQIGALRGSAPELIFAHGINWFSFGKQVGGEAVRVRWSVIHGDRRWVALFTRVPFDGQLTVQPLGENGWQVDYRGDCFPSIEAHVVPEDGPRISIMKFRHLGPEQGLAVAGYCKVTTSGIVE